jgi:hypothetical protein
MRTMNPLAMASTPARGCCRLGMRAEGIPHAHAGSEVHEGPNERAGSVHFSSPQRPDYGVTTLKPVPSGIAPRS